MDLDQIALLLVAGAAAGAINAAAGGGSLITFPALLAVGLPAISANVTNAVAQVPGYLGIVGGYRRELEGQAPRARRLAPVALAGSAVGVVALELSSEDTFRAIVPILILAACALLAAQPAIKRRLAERERGSRRHVLLLDAGVVLSGAYGAYFGAAVGVMLLAVLGALVDDTLQRLNALNRLLVLLVNLLAAAAFTIIAPVDWVAVAVLAPATLAGGLAGAVLARRLSDPVLRAIVITFGVVAAIYLLATG
jgi:uncharacterized membrane protein YfcA